MELEPDSVRYTYVYAVALHSTGRLEDARRLLERSLQRWPADRDLLFALASFQLEAGLTEAARQSVRRLLAAHPADRDANALAAQLGVTGGPGAAER
jgi:thioredoxin-like negative regulator of GroEL